MRIAGSREVFQQLASELADELAPIPAGGVPEADLEAFQEIFSLLLSKGYDRKAAIGVAEDMAAGLIPRAKTTPRFAGVFGETTEPRQP